LSGRATGIGDLEVRNIARSGRPAVVGGTDGLEPLLGITNETIPPREITMREKENESNCEGIAGFHEWLKEQYSYLQV
jgi:hypothetical protein